MAKRRWQGDPLSEGPVISFPKDRVRRSKRSEDERASECERSYERGEARTTAERCEDDEQSYGQTSL
jgi:hypothetical protein